MSLYHVKDDDGIVHWAVPPHASERTGGGNIVLCQLMVWLNTGLLAEGDGVVTRCPGPATCLICLAEET